MNAKDHNLAMYYLDKIVECLDEIADKVGHITFETFLSKEVEQS